MVLALLAVAAPYPAWAGSPTPWLDLGAGVGYDDNLNYAATADQREGSSFGLSWLSAGAFVPASEKLRFTLNGAYSGTYYADFDDLTVNALAVRSSCRVSASEASSITLGAGAGRRWYGDGDRNSTVYDAGLEFRRRWMSRAATWAGYRYASRAADESTFSSRGNRLTVGGEYQPVQGSWVGLGYTMETGQSVFYQSASVPIPSSGRGRRPSTTFGSNQVAFTDDTTTHTLSASWEQKALDTVFVRVEYAYAMVSADAGDVRDNLLWASVGYRY
jgi:hypothetical protein